jgi:hypothetical protein
MVRVKQNIFFQLALTRNPPPVTPELDPTPTTVVLVEIISALAHKQQFKILLVPDVNSVAVWPRPVNPSNNRSRI